MTAGGLPDGGLDMGVARLLDRGLVMSKRMPMKTRPTRPMILSRLDRSVGTLAERGRKG